jgi:hypothetical protein
MSEKNIANSTNQSSSLHVPLDDEPLVFTPPPVTTKPKEKEKEKEKEEFKVIPETQNSKILRNSKRDLLDRKKDSEDKKQKFTHVAGTNDVNNDSTFRKQQKHIGLFCKNLQGYDRAHNTRVHNGIWNYLRRRGRRSAHFKSCYTKTNFRFNGPK